MDSPQRREPWNKGKLVGQKPALWPTNIRAIRIQLQNAHQVRHQVRDVAMFNLAMSLGPASGTSHRNGCQGATNTADNICGQRVQMRNAIRAPGAMAC